MASCASDLILARLHALHPKSIDLSLGRVERLLAALGNPERRLAPVVHIAGTNGKGSTLAMLAAILQGLGRRVDRYISPHLVRFNERILIDGAPLGEDRLAACLERCEAANEGQPITFFEITTAAAFLAFAERPADWVLLETGLSIARTICRSRGETPPRSRLPSSPCTCAGASFARATPPR